MQWGWCLDPPGGIRAFLRDPARFAMASLLFFVWLLLCAPVVGSQTPSFYTIHVEEGTTSFSTEGLSYTIPDLDDDFDNSQKFVALGIESDWWAKRPQTLRLLTADDEVVYLTFLFYWLCLCVHARARVFK